MRILSALVVSFALLAQLPRKVVAQDGIRSTIDLKAGLAYGTLSNRAPNFAIRTGFAAGVALDIRGKLLGIQPELLYVQKGVTPNGAPSPTAPKLAYAEIPLLLKLTLRMPGMQPMVYAGPSLGLRMSCRVGEDACAEGTIKGKDWGAVLGAGLRLGGDKGLVGEARYTWGLKDIHDLSAGVASETRTFLLLLGFSL